MKVSKKEIGRQEESTHIVVNKGKKLVALIRTDLVDYRANLTDALQELTGDVAVSKYDYFGKSKPTIVYTYTTKEKTVLQARCSDDDEYDEITGLVLIGAFREFGSRSRFYKFCGNNDPENYAKMVIIDKFGSVDKYLRSIEDIVIGAEDLDKRLHSDKYKNN